MIITEITNRNMEMLSVAAFALGLTALFLNYGKQMLNERWAELNYSKEDITSDMINQYLKEQGCKVWHVSPEKNTTNWSAFIVKEGICYVVKVYTDSGKIIKHEHTLA